MAVPTVTGSSVAHSAVNGSVTGTLPSGVGDLLVAFVAVDNDNPATATGWTQQHTRGVGGTTIDITTTLLTAPASVGSLVFSWSVDTGRKGTVHILRVNGANATPNTIAGAGIGPTGNENSNLNSIPQVTTTVADCLLICGAGGDGTATAGADRFTWPAGWTEVTDAEDSTVFIYSGTARSSQASAGLTPAADVDATVADHYGRITVALAPGGTIHTQSPTDSAGLTDSATTTKTTFTAHTRSQTDSAGLTDSTVVDYTHPPQNYTQTPTDDAGLLDSISIFQVTPPPPAPARVSTLTSGGEVAVALT